MTFQEHPGNYQRKIRTVLRGLCYCGEPPEDGYALCKGCRLSASKRLTAARAARRAACECVRCGTPDTPPGSHCPACRKKRRHVE